MGILRTGLAAVVFCLALPYSTGARAETADSNKPAYLQADIEEHLGEFIPKDLQFQESSGNTVALDSYLHDGKPLVLVLAYFKCPMLCGLMMQGAVNAVGNLGNTPELGKDFRMVTVSFDPRDDVAAAAKKQGSLLSALGNHGAPREWPFLVGVDHDDSQIKKLAEALGFVYAYDKSTDQYAHPSALFVLTPEGKISRYLYGIQFQPSDLKLSVIEAGQGKVGSIIDRVLITCYRYNPSSRRYNVYILGVVRLGGVITLALLFGLILVLRRRERERGTVP